ncbi:MAG: SIS domain-containing protein [Acidilobaceae archaeon]
MAFKLLEYYSLWHDFLLEGFESGVTASESIGFSLESVRGVLFCGLGGSGIVGDFTRALEYVYGSKLPLVTIKSYNLPLWSKDYITYIISYSGDTLETILCFKKALELNSRIIAVSSGGYLGREASRLGLPWVKVRSGLLPRAALPLMLGGLLGSLSKLNIMDIPEDSLLEAYNTLRNTMADDAEPYVKVAYESDILVVGGCGVYSIVADRWRQEFSENTKMLVKSEIYPESAHNDIVAWQTKRSLKIGFIAIRGGDPICDNIVDIVVAKYREHGPVAELKLGMPSITELLRGAQIGGIASILVAQRRSVDPEATPVIAEYKEKLKKVIDLI